MSRDDLHYDAVLPTSLIFNPYIIPAAKLFYAILRNLCRKEGFCYAGNDYLSKLMDVKEDTINEWLNSLENQKYIRRDTKNINFVKKRKIFLDFSFHDFIEGIPPKNKDSNNFTDTREKPCTDTIEKPCVNKDNNNKEDREKLSFPKNPSSSKSSSLEKREREAMPPSPSFSFEKIKMQLKDKEYLDLKYGKEKVSKTIKRLNNYLIQRPDKKYARHDLKIAEWIEEDDQKSTYLSKDMSWYSEAKLRSNYCPYLNFDEDGVGIANVGKIYKKDDKFKEKVLSAMMDRGIKTENL